MKRREFIRIAAVTAPSLMSLPLFLEGCATNPFRAPAQDDPTRKPGPGTAKTIRPEVNSPEAVPHLRSYNAAIEKMRALPATDGRSWNMQAEVHNNHCWHNSWFFFPWHRDYLKRFQDIIRQQSGDPNFMLPYWDWTTNPGLPGAFQLPASGNINEAAFPQLVCSSPTWDQVADASRTGANPASVAQQIPSVTGPSLIGADHGGCRLPDLHGRSGRGGRD